MLLDTIFAPFVKERPICVMARAILERLLDTQRLDDLFARTAERQYTRKLLFSSLVHLMSEVVLGVHPTVHAAYQAQKDTIGVSTTALYNKLDRVETEVSAALVRASAALAEPVVKALRASHPRWLPGYQIKVLDGNHLSSTAHRLKELRSTWAAPLPGQALVVLDQQRMLITDVLLSEDSHAQERSLMAQVLEHVADDDLWIEDRNFCTRALMCGMARRGAAFVGLSQGRVVYLLLDIVGVQRRVAHQSHPTQCPWPQTDQCRGLGLLSVLGNWPYLRWHDDGDSRAVLGALSRTFSPGVCQRVGRACRVRESGKISETSSRSQEGASGTDRISKGQARLNRQAHCAQISMLKGLTVFGASAAIPLARRFLGPLDPATVGHAIVPAGEARNGMDVIQQPQGAASHRSPGRCGAGRAWWPRTAGPF
jgi:hypothetical protein